MPYPLNNVSVSNDIYDDARTCRFQLPVSKCFVSISGAACYMQLERVEPGMRAGTGSYLPEEFVLPGITTLDRSYEFGSIRFRRAVSTTTPQVTAR